MVIDSRLYGGLIRSSIANGDSDPDNFSDNDLMQSFAIAPIGGGPGLSFDGGNRTAFNAWARENASALLTILFPTSVSAGVSGRDTAQLQSQEFLLTTVLDATRLPRAGERTSGGMLEYERFTVVDGVPGDSAGAWQGRYRFDGAHLSIDGRFARQRIDTVATRATTVGVTYHPSRVVHGDLDWRVGLNARSSVLFSQSEAMNLGLLDLGAGVWTSARKDFSRVRIGAGTLFQGSRNHVPGVFAGDDFAFVADAINERGIAYDLAYGTVLGYAAAERISLNAKILETRAVAAEGNRPASRMVLASVSYLVGGITPVDVGYKVSTAGGLNTHGIFLQGNFGW
jgi:hypothetical protein